MPRLLQAMRMMAPAAGATASSPRSSSSILFSPCASASPSSPSPSPSSSSPILPQDGILSTSSRPWCYQKTSSRGALQQQQQPQQSGDRRCSSPTAAVSSTAAQIEAPSAASNSTSTSAASAAWIMAPAPASYHPPKLSIAPMMDWTDNYFRTLARLMTRRSWLYTEMVVAETIVHQADNLGRFLDFDEFQHPIVLQIGGNNPVNLAKAAQLASPFGYDEINLNCGCPSQKVAGHCFGASLMLDPVLVGKSMAAIAESCTVPVTVKCRIGVDNFDSYENLHTFVSTVASMSPTRHFVIHARKALLKGLSPAENRSIPPLKHEYVFALIRDFPHLNFTLNGGIISLEQAQDALQRGAYGVMMGRAAYTSSWTTLPHVDSVVFGERGPGLTRRQILEKYATYADATLGKYGPKRPNVRTLMKPLLHLFHAEPGASAWRRAVDGAFTIKKLKTVKEILEDTLPVIPDFVLDAAAPLPQQTSDSAVLAEMPPPPLSDSGSMVLSDSELQRTEELEVACT